MYCIDVKSWGKNNNVEPGRRYCFRKKTAKYLIDLFYTQNKCEIDVKKFVRLSGGIYFWTDCDEGDTVFKYFDDVWTDDDEEEW